VARFATTRWTLVLTASDARSPMARDALANLCEIYWPPVFSFIRRSGYGPEEARDLTQAFFTRLIEKEPFRDARPERGRFRSFLLAAVRYFLANQRDFEMAQKRGGRVIHLPIEIDDGERHAQIEPSHSDTPEREYERRWARAVVDQAIDRVGDQYRRTGRQETFARLRPYLTGDEPKSYAALASSLSVSEGTLRVSVHRLRQRVAAVLREIVAETVARQDEIDDELRYLMATLGK
jgi:RNA polymerase sigma-70 factor (ECF subfamily)